MESNKDEKELKRIDLPIRGMSCASCAVRIEKGLSSLEGVSKANVNFAAEKATVFFHPDQTEVSRLVQKVEELNYSARTKILLPVRMTASCVKS
jgi:Cu+-exporting ATPase